MRILWTKKAEKSLDKIFQHTVDNFSFELAERTFVEIKLAVSKLSDFPYLGRRIGGHEEKRQLVISGNAIIYEIVLGASPYIIIRNVRPRGTNQV
ncbi:MAG TPA: type II toxin-antitoxin system RelE/ParE family toxin [Pseudobdellovibrionaceae bacterium]|jgi:plasmid stabilization system protein ParE